MKFISLFFVTLCLPVLGATYTAVRVSSSEDFSQAQEYKAIMEQLKPYGNFSEKKETVTLPKAKGLSAGQKAVEEAKARNRAVLAQMREDQTKMTEPSTGSNALTEMQKLKLETLRVQQGWKKEVQETRALWRKEQAIFLGKIKQYESNTFEIPAPKEKIIEAKEIPALPDAFIVNGAFSMPVRDQKDRPTCAAFSGIRAVEILLAQNNVYQDLSEQYFYWASKPACQSSPCAEKGSWIVHGLNHSKSQRKADIPSENYCSYRSESLPKNETQLPMTGSCRSGIAKVENYEVVRTLSDVITTLKKNVPVIVSAKLTPNYYINQGLITLADENKGREKMDGHSLGHAFLAVGVIELPEKLKEQEGRYCIVVTNSWGTGWGAGGYSCMTERWFTKHRSPNAFVAVTRVSLDAP